MGVDKVWGVVPYGKSSIMNDFLKMDIFFFITSAVVVLFAILGAVVLWRLARVLKNIEHISEQVAAESDTIRADLAEVRGDIRKGKGRLKSLFSFFGKTAKRASKDT
ncbi:MAG: hypothetical protein NUV60_00705 [Patescibacteria group bacterium]|nr:hypothetical protein [Patescibacteria group bacterium]